MRTIQAYRLGRDDYVTYILPSKRKAIEHSQQTWGKVFDLRERREVEGGVPLAWSKQEQ